MTFQHKEGYGSLFPNKKKKEGDNKPNLQGEALLEGRKVQLAGWTKLDKNGQKYVSLKLQIDPIEP